MNVHRKEELLIAERAVDMLEKLKKGTATEKAAAAVWLRESPRHVRELILADVWNRALADIDPQRRIDVDALGGPVGTVTSLHDDYPLQRDTPEHIGSRQDEVRRTWLRRWWVSGLAAAATLLLVIWFGLGGSILSSSYATAVGEQRSIEIKDGSTVFLDTKSQISVDFTPEVRQIRLISGRARFKVAHDAARPFVVTIGNTRIRAVGTQFDVYARADHTTVAVIEGTVEISSTDPPTSPSGTAELLIPVRVTARELASIANDGRDIQKATVDIAKANAWRQRRLVFEAESLANISTEFNRYNRRQIVVEGEALRAKRFWGVFDADDPESLLNYLQNTPGIEFAREEGALIIRPARS